MLGLATLVVFSLFETNAATDDSGAISEPRKRALYLLVKENLKLMARLESNQREIHSIFRDQPQIGPRGFYTDSELEPSATRDRSASLLRANSDYAGVYSGFFREIPHAWPLRLDTLMLNSGYGTRGAVFGVFGQSEFHPGFDLRANYGTPVLASADGTVKSAINSAYGYGNYVVLLHSSGYETIYGHMTSVAVKRGQEVRSGQLIGYSGSTGASNGPHLHYEIRFDGKPVDPSEFLVF